MSKFPPPPRLKPPATRADHASSEHGALLEIAWRERQRLAIAAALTEDKARAATAEAMASWKRRLSEVVREGLLSQSQFETELKRIPQYNYECPAPRVLDAILASPLIDQTGKTLGFVDGAQS